MVSVNRAHCGLKGYVWGYCSLQEYQRGTRGLMITSFHSGVAESGHVTNYWWWMEGRLIGELEVSCL